MRNPVNPLFVALFLFPLAASAQARPKSFVTGFAPPKEALTLYITAGTERFPKLLAKLGKHKTGKGCLYIKTLDDVNLSVLEDLVKQSVEHTRAAYKEA